MSEPLQTLDRKWKSTCRTLFGDEIGGLEEYAGYLSRHLEPTGERKSAISGKKVVLSVQSYCPGAKFISNDEREQYNGMLRAGKLDINDIKDIDSIVGALGEKLYYAGNIITGNSYEVVDSDACSNSSFVYKSNEIYDCKYVAYSDAMNFAECVFGSNWIAETKFTIKTYETHKIERCFEAMRIAKSSDCYYVAAVEGCTNCLFSFNQRNRRNLIGNLELEAGEFRALKAKLVGEMRETLKSKKSAMTIVDLIRGNNGKGN